MHVAITGASGGLGAELAEHYARKGCSLSLSGRDESRLVRVSEACNKLGVKVSAQKVDIIDTHAMDDWLTKADALAPIDLLIANAGIGGADVVVSDHGETAQLAQRIVETNTTGTINTVAPLLPAMSRRQRGHIVIISSLSAAIGLPQSPVYCASKAALNIYADGLRRLLRPHGVGVTCVMPGFIDTQMSRSLNFPRPWCWSAEKAAKRIARDVENKRPYSIFPWQLRCLIGLGNFLPVQLSDFLLHSATRKKWPGVH